MYIEKVARAVWGKPTEKNKCYWLDVVWKDEWSPGKFKENLKYMIFGCIVMGRGVEASGGAAA